MRTMRERRAEGRIHISTPARRGACLALLRKAERTCPLLGAPPGQLARSGLICGISQCRRDGGRSTPGPFSGSPPECEVTSLCAQGRRILSARIRKHANSGGQDAAKINAPRQAGISSAFTLLRAWHARHRQRVAALSHSRARYFRRAQRQECNLSKAPRCGPRADIAFRPQMTHYRPMRPRPAAAQFDL